VCARVLAGTAVTVLVIDLITKELVVSRLTGHPPVRLLDGAVYLSLVRNSGAAFSLGTHFTLVFPLIALLVIGGIGWTAAGVRSVPWAVALGLVLGGAVGNLTDRVFRAPGFMVGHVVDFISVFNPYGQVFPIFNAADSSLCCGIVLAALLLATGRLRDGTQIRPERSDGTLDHRG
jgi:signal peptidase II